jgi:hypothetical protein
VASKEDLADSAASKDFKTSSSKVVVARRLGTSLKNLKSSSVAQGDSRREVEVNKMKLLSVEKTLLLLLNLTSWTLYKVHNRPLTLAELKSAELAKAARLNPALLLQSVALVGVQVFKQFVKALS